MSARKRIMKELDDLNKNPIKDIIAYPIEESDPFHWKASFFGLEGSPYEGGNFDIKITFPIDYPFKPPKCVFSSHIFHPNIVNGYICLDILVDQWSPALTISSVLLQIKSLLIYPIEGNEPYNVEAYYLFRKDKNEYFKKTRELAIIFGHCHDKKYEDLSGIDRINFELKYYVGFPISKVNDYKYKINIYKEIYLELDFPEEYPLKHPNFTFTTEIKDIHIRKNIKYFINNLAEKWNNRIFIVEILNSLKDSFCDDYPFKIINEEKEKNKKLNERIKELEELLEKEKKKNEEYMNKNNLEDKKKDYEIIKNDKKEEDNQIIIEEKNLYKKLLEKEKEINLLKLKISEFPFELKNKEKLLSIIIMSKDENVIFSIICKNTEKFRNLEDKFYEKYPNYFESKNSFECNGKEINVYKSLEDNKIKDNDIIIIKTN